MAQKYWDNLLNKLPRLSLTEIKRLLVQFNSENRLLNTLLNDLKTAILACSLDYKLLYANKGGQKLLNHQKKANLPLWQQLKYPDIAYYLEGFLLSESYGESPDFKLENRLFNLKVEPLAGNGQIEGYIISLQDVSQLRASQAMAFRNQSLANMANMSAAIAHEIKNPLGSISIHLQLIKRTLKGVLQEDEQLQADFSLLEQELERLNEVTTNFLYNTRPLNLILVQTDLRQTVSDTLALLKNEVEQNGRNLQFENFSKPCFTLIDESRIKQVLINLVQNSLAATPMGGFITVTLSCNDIEVTLAVTDNGEGISHKVAQHIFEPYFTTKNTGTGLGLTLAYKIIKDHQGDIKLNSPPIGQKQGSQFVITLPLVGREQNLLGYQP